MACRNCQYVRPEARSITTPMGGTTAEYSTPRRKIAVRPESAHVRAGILAKVPVLIQGNYCVLVEDRQEGEDMLRNHFRQAAAQ
jgi:hypothetical protein